jgi:urease accessory protein
MSFLLWQLADSAFPAGGFAHSAGLEAAVQLGEVTGRDELERFAGTVVRQAGNGALPFVTAAHLNPDAVVALDGLCDVFLSNPVANRASRAQGRAFLATCIRAFPRPSTARLLEIADHRHWRGHQAPLFGAALRVLEVDRLTTQRLFLFLAGRTVTSAAVRLGLVGPYEAQQVQMAIAQEIDRTAEVCADLPPSEIAHTAPLVDLFQSTHDRLYSRLFQS